MDPTKVKCHECDEPCFVDYEKEAGIIYVRAMVKDKWTNVPICMNCWIVKYRDTARDKINTLPKKDREEVAKQMIKKDFSKILSQLPKEVDSLQKVAESVWHITEKFAKMYPQYVCETFVKLNAVAMSVDHDSKDGAKHRRAVMQHPYSCEHPHCKDLAQFLKTTGMDKLSHPEYGSMNNSISKTEEDSLEDLK